MGGAQLSVAALLLCAVLLAGILNTYGAPGKAFAAETRSLKDITNMQEMTTEICTNSALGESKTLTDSRDGSTYVVQRLEDGNCWMLQNLKLTKESIEAKGNSATLSSDDSNVASGSTYTLPTSSQSSFNTDVAVNATYASPTAAYGTYYSWCAATAGCKTTSGADPGFDQEASASVCPKGWRLPTARKTSTTATGYNYSFNNLIDRLGLTSDAASSAKLQSEPYNFQAAGFVNGGPITNIGNFGKYWSSTSAGSSSANYLYFDANSVDPSYWDNRYFGYSVRCVAPANFNADGSPIVTGMNKDLQVRIEPFLTITTTSGMSETMTAANILHGNITAVVESNGQYNVLLSAAQPALKNATISAAEIPANADVRANNSAWAIRNADGTTYKPVTTNEEIFYSATAFDDVVKSYTHTFTVGVSVAPNIPSGKYSTNVTVTVANT